MVLIHRHLIYPIFLPFEIGDRSIPTKVRALQAPKPHTTGALVTLIGSAANTVVKVFSTCTYRLYAKRTGKPRHHLHRCKTSPSPFFFFFYASCVYMQGLEGHFNKAMDSLPSNGERWRAGGYYPHLPFPWLSDLPASELLPP